MTPKKIIDCLTDLSFENTFNPYVDFCETFDYPNAPQQRRALLLAILQSAAKTQVDALWIGRDLGYRGGRRTGLALTDDAHMQAHAKRWGIEVERPTKGAAVKERTATVIWELLQQIEAPIFLWNVFPLHPHKPFQPFSNRNHNSEERKIGEDILLMLISLMSPRRIVAIGTDAAESARKITDVEVISVRHPSYGGQNEFIAGVRNLYSLPSSPNLELQL